MEIKLKSGLKFKKINYKDHDSERQFFIMYDRYFGSKQIMMLAVFPDHIKPITKVDLRLYMPEINGKYQEDDYIYTY